MDAIAIVLSNRPKARANQLNAILSGINKNMKVQKEIKKHIFLKYELPQTASTNQK